MQKNSSRTDFVLALAALVLLLPSQSHAYLDPGAGSYAVQVGIAAIVGGGYAIKVFGKRVITKLVGLFKKKE